MTAKQLDPPMPDEIDEVLNAELTNLSFFIPRSDAGWSLVSVLALELYELTESKPRISKIVLPKAEDKNEKFVFELKVNFPTGFEKLIVKVYPALKN